MTINPTIDLGTIVSAIAVAGLVVGCYVSIIRQLAELRTMVKPLWSQFLEDKQ